MSGVKNEDLGKLSKPVKMNIQHSFNKENNKPKSKRNGNENK